ncbi:MAG: sigma-70 family RNA polymerase sigma factor [Planctomycetota bacterium]
MDEQGPDLGAIAAAMGGDREALRSVWRVHRRWVAAILLAHKARGTDLDDLLQAVAVQLCKKIADVREPEAFRAWLRMVAINIARADGRSVTRKRQGFLRLVGRSDDRGDEAAGERSARNEDAARLMSLAMTLPEGYREPLLMRCVKGMSYRQIGDAMDLPETTIETRIARGRRMLRELASGEQAKPGARAAVTAGNA